MNKELTATEFARNQAEYLNRVAYKGESFIITRGKKPIAELRPTQRSEEHTSELQSHSEISYAVFCLKKKIN